MRLAKTGAAGESASCAVRTGRLATQAFTSVEGERFVVTDANWNQPFAAIVQVDPKLDHPSEATFEVRSGNLPLAWSVTFFVVAGRFLAICLYHFIVLPRRRPMSVATRSSDSAAAGWPASWCRSSILPQATDPGDPGISACCIAFRKHSW